MYTWLRDTGEKVKTKTIKEFAQKYDCPYSHAKNLASGWTSRWQGFCSTASKAKVERDRFMTVLVNTTTGEHKILGRSVKYFAKVHGLCFNELSKLVNGRKILYRSWCLEKTLRAASFNLAGANF